MLEPGDTIVYRHHVCTIARIRENYFEGKDYFELHALFENSLKLYVECDRAVPPAVRPVMGEAEMLALIDSISEAPAISEDFAEAASTSSLAERRAKSAYEQYLKTFSQEDLASIIKSAHDNTVKRERTGHKGMAVDKKYLELAEGLLCDELSVSLGIPRENARDFLVKRIKQNEKSPQA